MERNVASGCRVWVRSGSEVAAAPCVPAAVRIVKVIRPRTLPQYAWLLASGIFLSRDGLINTRVNSGCIMSWRSVFLAAWELAAGAERQHVDPRRPVGPRDAGLRPPLDIGKADGHLITVKRLRARERKREREREEERERERERVGEESYTGRSARVALPPIAVTSASHKRKTAPAL